MFEDIMKNVEKELKGQYAKVKEIEAQRGMLTKRVGQIEAQIAECKVVLMELGKFFFSFFGRVLMKILKNFVNLDFDAR